MDYPLFNFSSNAENLAYSDPTGTIKIWETISGLLKHEYAPSSHLSVTCTCLSWCPKPNISRHKESPNKKKRKLINQSENLDLISFGTSSGTIILYSSRQSALSSQLTEGHTDKVTGICWSNDGNDLFSCSIDQQIIHWDVNNSIQIHRWSSNQELHSICLCHTQTHLIVGGQDIQLWDLESHKILQTFVGHTNDVLQLVEVPVIHNKHVINGGSHSVEGSYIISSAINENKISVRQIGTKKKVTDIVASFVLSEEPYHFSINRDININQLFQMIAITRLGHLSYFECHLDGLHKKPFKAMYTTSIVTKEEKSRTMPITAAAFTNSADSIIITYEDFLRPVFEKISIDDLKTTLIRENIRKCKLSKQETISKVKFPKISSDIKVINGVNMSITPTPTTTKKRKKNMHIEEISLGERGISNTSPAIEKNLHVDTNIHSFCVLLTQGLQSEDKQMINTVLQRNDENIIRSTISNLSLSSIQLLTLELQRRLIGHATSGRMAIKWLKILIEIHSSYLLTIPAVSDFLGNMIGTLETPPPVLNKLLQLKGKLDAIISQMSLQSKSLLSEQKAAIYELNSGVLNSEDDLIVEDVRHIEDEETNWSENDEELEPLNDHSDNNFDNISDKIVYNDNTNSDNEDMSE